MTEFEEIDIKESLTKEGLEILEKTGKIPATFGTSDERFRQSPEASK